GTERIKAGEAALIDHDGLAVDEAGANLKLQLRQLGDIRRDPSRLVFGEQLGGRIAGRQSFAVLLLKLGGPANNRPTSYTQHLFPGGGWAGVQSCAKRERKGSRGSLPQFASRKL